MRTSRRAWVLAVAGLAAFVAAGGANARGQGYGATVSGPGYSSSWGHVPGYGDYHVIRNTVGGVTTTINVGAPPVYVIGPGGYGYVVPGGPALGVSTSGPGYAYSWGRTPGVGGYFQSTTSAGGVTSSIGIGAPMVYAAAPVAVDGPGYAQRPAPQRQVVRRRRVARAATLPTVIFPRPLALPR